MCETKTQRHREKHTHTHWNGEAKSSCLIVFWTIAKNSMTQTVINTLPISLLFPPWRSSISDWNIWIVSTSATSLLPAKGQFHLLFPYCSHVLPVNYMVPWTFSIMFLVLIGSCWEKTKVKKICLSLLLVISRIQPIKKLQKPFKNTWNVAT